MSEAIYLRRHFCNSSLAASSVFLATIFVTQSGWEADIRRFELARWDFNSLICFLDSLRTSSSVPEMTSPQRSLPFWNTPTT